MLMLKRSRLLSGARSVRGENHRGVLENLYPYRKKVTEGPVPTSCDSAKALTNVEIGLLTGCQDRHYAFAMAMALTSNSLCLDVIGSDEVDSPQLHTAPKLNFLNLGGRQQQNACLIAKVWRLFSYYARLIR